MATLYMFGNGFDIAHGIHTPYSEFRKFLQREHETFLTKFEEMYNIQPLDDTEPWDTEAALPCAIQGSLCSFTNQSIASLHTRRS